VLAELELEVEVETKIKEQATLELIEIATTVLEVAPWFAQRYPLVLRFVNSRSCLLSIRADRRRSTTRRIAF
jgi:hypothetical protein